MTLSRIKPAYILLPLAGLFALGLFAQKKAAAMLSYFISRVAVGWDGAAPLIKLDLAVQNPSNEQFTIKSITASAYSNGGPIGNISMFETIIIPANSQRVLPLVVRLNLTAAVSDLLSIIQRGSGNPQEITVKGYVNANGFVSPLNLTYKIA